MGIQKIRILSALKLSTATSAVVAAFLTFWVALEILTSENSNVLGSKGILHEKTNVLWEKNSKNSLGVKDQEKLIEGLVNLDDFQKVEDLIEEMIAKSPKDSDLRIILAELKIKEGKALEALEEIETINTIEPNNIYAIKLKAMIQILLGNNKSAIEFLDTTFKSFPIGSRLQVGMLLADAQYQAGKMKLASETYRLLAEENPKVIDPLLGLALLKQEQNEFESAQEILTEARKRRATLSDTKIEIDTLAGMWGILKEKSKLNIP